MTCQKLSITTAHTPDAGPIAEIIKASHTDVARRFDLTKDNCPKHPSNCITEWIEQDMQRGVNYFILNLDDIPVGCVAVEQAAADLCYIERLSVLPKNRHLGYGIRLMNHAFSVSRQMGAVKASIGIIEAFDLLKNWYKKIGFHKKETLTFDHLPFTVLIMEYQL